MRQVGWLVFFVASKVFAAAPSLPKLAVLEVQASGIAAEHVPLLNELLSTEMAGLKQYDVISIADVKALLGLQATRNMLGCDTDSCIAEIGGALGADKLFVSHIGKLADTYVVNLKLIDVKGVRTDARVYESIKGDIDVLLPAIRNAVRRLFGLSAPGSRLALPVTLWGVGGVGVVAAAVFGWRARTFHDHATDPTYPGGQLEIDDGVRSQRIANIGLAVGLLSAAAGAFVYHLSGSTPTQASSPAGAASLASGGGG